MSFFSSHTSKIESDTPGLVFLGVALALAAQAAFYLFAAEIRVKPRREPFEVVTLPPIKVERVHVPFPDAQDQPIESSGMPLPLDEAKTIPLASERPAEEGAPAEVHVVPRPSGETNPFDSASGEERDAAVLREKVEQAASQAALDAQERLRADQMDQPGQETALEGSVPALPEGTLASAPETNAPALLRGVPAPDTHTPPPGYETVESLLAAAGPVGGGSKPLYMPADLLFEFDQYTLQPAAESSLRKLGELIRRNPQAVFVIEGYTDSFGTEEYNLVLSRRRAETVAAWLVQNLGINPAQIQTRGLGETKLLVPGDRTREEQALNRRVEIVIRNRPAR